MIARASRLQSLLGKALEAAPELVRHPAQLFYAMKGVHWATLNMIDVPWLRTCGIDTVLDIGANTGQFAGASRVVFPRSFIYSFEPLPDCVVKLNRRMAGDTRFRAFNVAIGDRNGEEGFYRSSFPESSSMLPMSAGHRAAFPWTAGTSLLTVSMRTLDSFLDELDLGSRVLLKVDVQGFEKQVLAGGLNMVSRSFMVVIEVSFSPLYEGEASFEDIQALMSDRGFAFCGLLDQLVHPRTGRVLQGDAIYLRRGDVPE